MTASKTHSAHLKALSRDCKDPPTKGAGGFGSYAIHHPTGILTVFIPFLGEEFEILICNKAASMSLHFTNQENNIANWMNKNFHHI
jgi:hypothetical protein